jgi:2-oxoglutarate ferredoxin oxidoreductase subunit alpha
MTQRRFSKIKLLEEDEYERDRPEEKVALVPWGGSKGPALEAYNQLKESGVPVSWYYTIFLNPLPPKMLAELREKDLVIVPELNYQGQFAGILRSLGVKAESINQYTGLPFKVRDLVEKVTGMTNASRREMVRA